MPGTWTYRMVIQALPFSAYFSLPFTFALIFLASLSLFISHPAYKHTQELIKNLKKKKKKNPPLFFSGSHLITTLAFILPSQ